MTQLEAHGAEVMSLGREQLVFGALFGLNVQWVTFFSC